MSCFDNIKIPGLKEQFTSRIKEGMTDEQIRDIGTQVAKEHFDKLSNDLDKLKTKIGVKNAVKATINTKEAEKEKVEEEYKAKAEVAKEKEAKAAEEIEKNKPVRAVFAGSEIEGKVIGEKGDTVWIEDKSGTKYNVKKSKLLKEGEHEFDKIVGEDINVGESKNTLKQYVDKATAVLNQLFPNHKIEVYESTDEYVKATNRNKKSAGVYNRETKTISINLELIKKTKSGNTIFHEVIHPIVDEVLSKNPEVLDSLYSKIDALRKDPELGGVFQHEEYYKAKVKEVDGKFRAVDPLGGVAYDFDTKSQAEQYIDFENAKDDNKYVAKLETVTEFLTKIADGTVDPNKVSKNLSTKIIDAVNEVLKALGIRQISTAGDLRALSDAIKKSFDTADASSIKEVMGKIKEENGTGSFDALKDDQRTRIEDVVKRFPDVSKDELIEKFKAKAPEDIQEISDIIDSVRGTEERTSERTDPPKTPISEGYATLGEGEGVAIRKAKQIEIKAVQEAYEKQGVKLWSETMKNGLEKMQKDNQNLPLYDAALSTMRRIKDGGDYGSLSRDEALAGMQYLKYELGSRRSNLLDRISSENEIERKGAMFEDNLLADDYVDTALTIKNITTEAGRTLNYAQSELLFDPEHGLQLRRMDLIKANGGKPLSEADAKWTQEMWEKEKAIHEKEMEAREAGMKESFEKQIAQLKDEYAKTAEQKPGNPKSKTEVFKKTGKAIADKIRSLKMGKNNPRMDFTLGTWDLAVEGIAKLVEGGASIAEAIDTLIKEKKIGFKTDRDRKALEDVIHHSLMREDIRSEAVDKIGKEATESGSTSITNEMVKSGAIRDFVNSHIGEFEQKQLLDEAAKALKKTLPDVTKKQLLEAYLKEGEFKQPTKKAIEGSIAEAKKQLNNIAKLEEDIEDLSDMKAVRKRVFSTEREKSEYEKQLSDTKAEKLKELQKKQSELRADKSKEQANKDKIDELNANIQRAKNNQDIITTHRNKSDYEINEEIERKKKELKKAIRDNKSDDKVQDSKLADAKKKVRNDIAELRRKLDEGDFEDDALPTVLKKSDAELIKLNKEKGELESQYYKKKNELQEKNKSNLERVADFARAVWVNILIGAPKTLYKIGAMAVARPLSEFVSKGSFGKAFDAFFPGISEVAKKGGESNSYRSLQQGFDAYIKQFGKEKMIKKIEESNKLYDTAKKEYEDYKKSDDADPKKLKELKETMQGRLLDAQGNLIYQFIGGSSFKDAWKAFVDRANNIESLMGKVHDENFKKGTFKEKWDYFHDSKEGNPLDKTTYLLNFIGRSHSALKTFSGRQSFASGFMARLEGALKDDVDISNPDRILEIAHESYLDWERGKYQQGNFISDRWNEMVNGMMKKNPNHPNWDTYNKALSFLVKADVAITRVPVNIIHEAVMEYTLGAFRAIGMAAKAEAKARGVAVDAGIPKDTPEFKAAVKDAISKMDAKQAATIARCFRKGGLGIGLYAFSLIYGGIQFGVFPHMGQKKKKEESELGADELNPGQVEIGGHKFGEMESGAIEHAPALFPMFMGLGMAHIYHDDVKHGKSPQKSMWDAIYTHLKIIEGHIPQTKVVSPITLIGESGKTVFKRLNGLGVGVGLMGEDKVDHLAFKKKETFDPTKDGFKVYDKETHTDRRITQEEHEAYEKKREEIYNGYLSDLRDKGSFTHEDSDGDNTTKVITKDSYGDIVFKERFRVKDDDILKIDDIPEEAKKKIHESLMDVVDAKAKRILFKKGTESTTKQ